MMNLKSVRWNWTPLRSLSIVWLVTLAALVAFLWCAYDSYRRFADAAQRNLRIQELRGLLPTVIPETPSFEIEGWSQPADQTGGAYFDWMELPNGATLITLADVSKHGIGPALVLITDGFFEWANNQGGQYGIARLKAFVEAYGHEPPSMFIKRLHEGVIAQAGGAVQPDDLTVVIVKRCAEAPCLASSSSAKEERVATNAPVLDVERNGPSTIRS